MPAPVRATQLRPRISSASAVTAAGAATVTQEPYRARSRCGNPRSADLVAGSTGSAARAGTLQPPGSLGDGAGHRGIHGERLRHLIYGEPLRHSNRHRIDQLTGARGDYYPADHDAGHFAADELDAAVTAGLHLGAGIAPQRQRDHTGGHLTGVDLLLSYPYRGD